jgi:hypothetical protein
MATWKQFFFKILTEDKKNVWFGMLKELPPKISRKNAGSHLPTLVAGITTDVFMEPVPGI